MRRGPLPQLGLQKLTAAAFIAPMLGVAVGYAGRFAVVPDIDDRSGFWAGIAGFLAGTAVAYPVIWPVPGSAGGTMGTSATVRPESCTTGGVGVYRGRSCRCW